MKASLLTLSVLIGLLGSSLRLAAQDLGNISKQKAFSFHGSVGASATVYSSNESSPTQPPFGWNLYGNFTPSFYGIALPFSFVVNQYGNSYATPFAQFGISPTYKWIKLHLGYRSVSFSPLTFDGQSFKGVGLELAPKGFRLAAFYGSLNRKVNEDTTSGKYALPQFSRLAYGARIGVGSEANHLDFIYLHARDDSSSITVINKLSYRPQENTVLGTSFRVGLLKIFNWSGDFALSGLTPDLGATAGKGQDSGKGGLDKIMNHFLAYNSSSQADWALQSSLAMHLPAYNTVLSYRRVQPGFKSLGTPYMLSDVELVNWLNNFYFLKGKLSFNTSLSDQRTNLKNNLPSGINTFVATAGFNAQASQQVNISGNYSGYNLRQTDGNLPLADSLRLHQQINQFSLSPSYTRVSNGTLQSLSVSGNYMELTDLNPATAPFSNSNNLAAVLSYTYGLVKKALNFTLSGLHTQYKQSSNTYTSNGINLSSSKQLLKEQNLGLQGTVGYLFNRSTLGTAKNNLTFSGSVNYRLKHHVFNAFANYVYTPYNPINNIINKQVPSAVATRNFMGGLSYTYSF